MRGTRQCYINSVAYDGKDPLFNCYIFRQFRNALSYDRGNRLQAEGQLPGKLAAGPACQERGPGPLRQTRGTRGGKPRAEGSQSPSLAPLKLIRQDESSQTNLTKPSNDPQPQRRTDRGWDSPWRKSIQIGRKLI